MALIPNWIRHYAEGRLRAGSAVEESFCLFIDSKDQIVVADFHRVAEPTVRFFIDEDTAWKLAARNLSVYSAFSTSLPLRADGDAKTIQPLAFRVEGEFAMRDMELMDEILQLFYDVLREEGHNLAEVVARQLAGVQ